MCIRDSNNGADGTVILNCHKYVSSGLYTSKTFDAGEIVNWKNSTVTLDTPPGTSVNIEYGENNSGEWRWYSNIKDVPDSRWLKIRILLTTENTSLTPSIDKISVY